MNYRNETITVGTASTVLSTNKGPIPQRRMAIIITNTSTGGQTICLSIGDEATANEGIVLYPGGSWEQSTNGGYYPPQDRINAISSLAGGTVGYYEEVQ